MDVKEVIELIEYLNEKKEGYEEEIQEIDYKLREINYALNKIINEIENYKSIHSDYLNQNGCSEDMPF